MKYKCPQCGNETEGGACDPNLVGRCGLCNFKATAGEYLFAAQVSQPGKPKFFAQGTSVIIENADEAFPPTTEQPPVDVDKSLRKQRDDQLRGLFT